MRFVQRRGKSGVCGLAPGSWLDRKITSASVAVFAASLLFASPCHGYSVQTHEQIIDFTWQPEIIPLLRLRFPGITSAQLTEAHSYAYGGCAIQDLGYYPFGNKLFSDLTHYVRTGDFVLSLLRNASTPDELAFAVGALSHYVGDVTGHFVAVNPSVSLEFPRLRAKYGDAVAYDEAPHAHVRTEFAFDVNQIALGKFAPSAYLRHVGIQVSPELLEKAFFETYGLRIDESKNPKRMRTYRFGVRHLLPRLASSEALLHARQMPADQQTADFVMIQNALFQASAENGWEGYRRKPGAGTYLLAGVIVIVPKLGLLSDLSIKVPDEATEQLYLKSLVLTLTAMRKVVGDIRAGDAQIIAAELANRDLDTGLKVTPGAYRLTDETYAVLLRRVTLHPENGVPSGLKNDIEAYYANPLPPDSKKHRELQSTQVTEELEILRAMNFVPEPGKRPGSWPARRR